MQDYHEGRRFSLFPTPHSEFRIRTVRLFENAPVFEHYPGPPYKTRSTIAPFSDTRAAGPGPADLQVTRSRKTR